MATYVSHVRNVNEAFAELMRLASNPSVWRKVSPRGMETLEFRGTFITEYSHPFERVLFSAVRDANPFFHFMESLWIMAGRDDVAFLNQFNSNIGTYSDDGKTFNAPYGYRLRKHFERFVSRSITFGDGVAREENYETVDQIAEVIDLLRREPDTRRAVLCLWDPIKDLNRDSKDIPCNDLVAFKLRDGALDMTVMNRSNDAMWGAYGANAVQFSVLHEFVACAVDVLVGNYRQISDSFHVYTSQLTWQKCVAVLNDKGFVNELVENPYVDNMGRARLNTVKLFERANNWQEWLVQNAMFLNQDLHPDVHNVLPFFTNVAEPIWSAWAAYKNEALISDKNRRIDVAQLKVSRCEAEDWRLACCAWLERRRPNVDERVAIPAVEPWGKDRP
jgi:thymidylate synthase